MSDSIDEFKLKVCVHYFFIFSTNDSLSKIMKNAFIDHLKNYFLFSRYWNFYGLFPFFTLPRFKRTNGIIYELVCISWQI